MRKTGRIKPILIFIGLILLFISIYLLIQTTGEKETMSYILNQAYNASKHIDQLKRKLCSSESAEGALTPEDWVIAVVKLSCIFVIGLFILNNIIDTNSMNESDAFYSLAISVKSQITSGYTLASLLILVVGSAAITHYLGFI
jgi:hypothetical protein